MAVSEEDEKENGITGAWLICLAHASCISEFNTKHCIVAVMEGEQLLCNLPFLGWPSLMWLLSREKFQILIKWWKAKPNDKGLIKEGEKRRAQKNQL